MTTFWQQYNSVENHISLYPELKDKQYYKFSAYGFLKNLRFYDAFLLIFFLDNQITYSQIGILYAGKELIANISEVPSGIIADTLGRKNVLVGAFLLYILSFILLFISDNFYFYLLAMLTIGIGDAFRSGTHKSMIMHYLQQNNWSEYKTLYYGSTRSFSQLGSAISALVAGFIIFYTGEFRLIFLLALIPYVLNLLNIISYPKDLNLFNSNKKASKSFQLQMRNFFQVIKQRSTLGIINSAALHSAFLKSIKDYIQPLIVNLALLTPFLLEVNEENKSGLILGITYFFIFLLSSFASKNAFKIANLKIPNLGEFTLLIGLIIGILCGTLYHFQLWYIAFILFVLIYLLENLRKPILTGLLAENVPNEILTSVISTQSFYQTLVTSLLALSLGFLSDLFNVGIAILSISIILTIFTVVVYAFNPRLPQSK